MREVVNAFFAGCYDPSDPHVIAAHPIDMDWDGRIFDMYRPTTMPTTFMINREGVVSRRIVNYANEAMLRIFLKGRLDQ